MRPTYLKKENYPVCPSCNVPMILDDVDYDFEGKQDEYWICPRIENGSCEHGAFVKVRYGKVCKIDFN